MTPFVKSAFVVRVALPLRLCTQKNVSTKQKTYFRACAISPALSPAASALIERQLRNPIFNPSLLEAPLRSTLSHLQSESPPAFLTSSHLSHLQSSAPQINLNAADIIAQHTLTAVQTARAHILSINKGIDEPGGDLWPEHRSQACWRDLVQFARVAGYICVTQQGLCDDGISIMSQIYAELNVPLKPLSTALLCVQEQLAVQAAKTHDRPTADVVHAAFDKLLAFLNTF